MTDVIHDPATDWCACEPRGDVICDYRLLADAVIQAFNPPDGDGAEVSICIDALMLAADVIANSDCTCLLNDRDPEEPCRRCAALGQWRGRPVDR